MKKIFTSIAVIAACAVGASAQKNADLSIGFVNPVHAQELPNKNTGDTIQFRFQVANAGPDAVTTTDTLRFWLRVGGQANGTKYWVPVGGPQNGIAIASGASGVLSISYAQGATVAELNDGTPVVMTWPNNGMDTFAIGVVGKGQDNEYFMDPGTDGFGDFETTETGNNWDIIVVRFGGTGILESYSIKNRESLSVYPNPTNGELKFDYDFKNVTDAAAVRVMDMTGRVVYTQALGKQAAGKQAFNINLGNLANGMYTIELNAGENRATSQFNINK